MIPFWTRASKFPPILVRLLARHRRGPPLTDQELSRLAGLPIHQVFLISNSTDWTGIDLPTAHRFLVACGVDFENYRDMERIESYLRKPTWKYLRVSPLWSSQFAPLLRKYRNSIK